MTKSIDVRRLKLSKCGCGLVMRKEEWASHWRTCKNARSVEITEQDIKDFQVNEKRMGRV